ncbi:MAG: hypothetical protein AAB658_12125 [Chloroflexota bacterium]
MDIDKKKWFKAASFLLLAVAMALNPFFSPRAGGEGEDSGF